MKWSWSSHAFLMAQYILGRFLCFYDNVDGTIFHQWLAPACCYHHHSYTQEWAHACTHTHTHTHTQSNTVTLSLATSSLVAVLAIARAAHLICIVYVLQFISLHISQATQVRHITVNGGAFSAAFLYTRPQQSLNLHVHTLDKTQLSTSFCRLSSWLLHVWCCHQYIYLMPRQSCTKPTIHSEACRKKSPPAFFFLQDFLHLLICSTISLFFATLEFNVDDWMCSFHEHRDKQKGKTNRKQMVWLEMGTHWRQTMKRTWKRVLKSEDTNVST